MYSQYKAIEHVPTTYKHNTYIDNDEHIVGTNFYVFQLQVKMLPLI